MSSFSNEVEEEIKEDFLQVDSKIPGQNFVCLSFVSPEKMLKQKEVYFTTKFLEHFFNGEDRYTKDMRENISKGDVKLDYDTIKKFYEDWKYTRNEVIERQFYDDNDNTTTMRGLKIRGVYDTHKEASIRAQVLRKKDPNFHVFVGQVGYWLPWDPEAEGVQEQEYQEQQLNDLVKMYKENLENKDTLYEQETQDKIRKARSDVEVQKQKLKEENIAVKETDLEDVKKIEELREIVDESDKLYYESMKKIKEEEKAKAAVEVSVKQDETKQEDEINNFKVENMETLESEDPWMKKKEEEVDVEKAEEN